MPQAGLALFLILASDFGGYLFATWLFAQRADLATHDSGLGNVAWFLVILWASGGGGGLGHRLVHKNKKETPPLPHESSWRQLIATIALIVVLFTAYALTIFLLPITILMVHWEAFAVVHFAMPAVVPAVIAVTAWALSKRAVKAGVQ